MEKLPLDILANILSRLPIESLAHSKYVSKKWHSTIVQNPSFAKSHFAASRNRDPSLILLYEHLLDNLDSKKPISDLFLLDLDEPHRNSDNTPYQMVTTCTDFYRSDRLYDIVGSCNGIICFSIKLIGFPAYLCNPILGEYLTLPPNPEWYHEPARYAPSVTGFGCDPVTGEYKVVRLFSKEWERGYYESEAEEWLLECSVLTIRDGRVAGSWREIGDVPFPILDSTGVLFNGRLHWVSKHDCGVDVSECVVWFDLRDEKFGLLPSPAFGSSTKLYTLSLGVLGDCLCLFDTAYDQRLHVWVMKEYGRGESWVKEYVIKRRGSTRFPEGDIYQPVCLWNDGEVLIERRRRDFVSYDPKTGMIREVKVRGGFQTLFGSWGMMTAVPHVCSIISLKNMQGGQNGTGNEAQILNVPRHDDSSIGGWDTVSNPWVSHEPESPIVSRRGIPVVVIPPEMLVDEYFDED